MKKLVEGFSRFKQEIFPQQESHFQKLATGQSPEALFITCADSRVVPDLFTQSSPGDLFLSRNIGNIVPPYGDVMGGVTAVIEYAVIVLKVKNIVVCGHTDCGAMKAVLHPDKLRDLPAASSWLRYTEAARHIALQNDVSKSDEELLYCLTEENIIQQLGHLRTHPAVAAGLKRGELELYGWLYHIHSGEIISYDASTERFVPLDSYHVVAATPPSRMHLATARGGL